MTTPTPSATEARERLARRAQGPGFLSGMSYAEAQLVVTDLRALLAREEALVGALRELCLVLRLAALKYGFDLTGSASMESADAILNPDPIPETAEGDEG